MPMPPVDPMLFDPMLFDPMPFAVLLPMLSRRVVPDEAQDASYLAASARMASFSSVLGCVIRSLYVPNRHSASPEWRQS